MENSSDPIPPTTPEGQAGSNAPTSGAGTPGGPFPGYPGYSGYPSYPGVPQSAPYPSPYPLYPGAPSMPLPPDPNVLPAQPGSPSQTYPGYSGPPTQPGAVPYLGYPPYPGYTGYPGYPPPPGVPVTVPLPGSEGQVYISGYGLPATVAAQTVKPASWNPASWIKGPLPAPLTALIALFTLLVIAAGAVVGIVLNQGDWASGAMLGGETALGLALLYAIGIAVRAALGRRAREMLLLGAASMLVLAALGGSGFALLPKPLHRAQAQLFEHDHKWTNALAQYQLAGERPPDSHDLARVYDEWGDELEQQREYVQASTQYEYVVSTFPAATIEFQRARTSDARVLFEYGTQLVGQGAYQSALDEFIKIINSYPGTPYANQAYTSAATAYLTLGKQAIQSGNCSAALPIYETLVQQFPDTAEGKEAKQALAAPVAVSGHITNLLGKSTDYVALSSKVTGAVATGPTNNFDGTNLSQDYRVQLNSDGQYTFAAVAQGKYDLALFFTDGSIVAWYNSQPAYTPYTVIVGPLCPVSVSTYSD